MKTEKESSSLNRNIKTCLSSCKHSHQIKIHTQKSHFLKGYLRLAIGNNTIFGNVFFNNVDRDDSNNNQVIQKTENIVEIAIIVAY